MSDLHAASVRPEVRVAANRHEVAAETDLAHERAERSTRDVDGPSTAGVLRVDAHHRRLHLEDRDRRRRERAVLERSGEAALAFRARMIATGEDGPAADARFDRRLAVEILPAEREAR